MKITASATINAHYPTVTYGSLDVNFTQTVEQEFPEGTDIGQACQFVSAVARSLAQGEWLKLRDEVESGLVAQHKATRILPLALEQQLMSEGRIKR